MITINVYLDNGNVFMYEVTDEKAAREHAHAIAQEGYRQCGSDGEFSYYPAHRILKIKFKGATTSYPDKMRGT